MYALVNYAVTGPDTSLWTVWCQVFFFRLFAELLLLSGFLRKSISGIRITIQQFL